MISTVTYGEIDIHTCCKGSISTLVDPHPIFVVEIATLTRPDGEEKTIIKVLPGSEVDKLIGTYYKEEERKKGEEKAKQEKSSATSSAT